MRIIRIITASAAVLALSATATLSAEAPEQRASGVKIGQLSTPTAKLPIRAAGPRAKTAIKVAQRWRRRSRRRRNRGGAIAGAVALGIAAIIASEAARSHDRHNYGRSCRKWARLCDRGRDWACDKYDYRC